MFKEKMISIAKMVYAQYSPEVYKRMNELFDLAKEDLTILLNDRMTENAKVLDIACTQLQEDVKTYQTNFNDRLVVLDAKQEKHIRTMEEHAKLLEGWLQVFMHRNGLKAEVRTEFSYDVDLNKLRDRIIELEKRK